MKPNKMYKDTQILWKIFRLFAFAMWHKHPSGYVPVKFLSPLHKTEKASSLMLSDVFRKTARVDNYNYYDDDMVIIHA